MSGLKVKHLRVNGFSLTGIEFSVEWVVKKIMLKSVSYASSNQTSSFH